MLVLVNLFLKRVMRIEHRNSGIGRIINFQRHSFLGRPWMPIEFAVDDFEVRGISVQGVGAGVHREKSAAVLNPIVKRFHIQRQVAGGVKGNDARGFQFLRGER